MSLGSGKKEHRVCKTICKQVEDYLRGKAASYFASYVLSMIISPFLHPSRLCYMLGFINNCRLLFFVDLFLSPQPPPPSAAEQTYV